MYAKDVPPGTIFYHGTKADLQVGDLLTPGCDCSLCTKRNALMIKVPEAALRMEAGDEKLTRYEWNTRRARHYFCSICGIYVFHRKRAAPDHFGVNVFCLTGLK